MDRSVKAQMKYADKTGALFTLVIGEEELKLGTATLKSMKDGAQTPVLIDADKIVETVKRG